MFTYYIQNCSWLSFYKIKIIFSSLVFVYDALEPSDQMAATTARLVNESKKVLEGKYGDTIEVASWNLSKEGVLKFCARVPLNEN